MYVTTTPTHLVWTFNMATTAEAKNIKELEHTTLLNPEAEVLYFSMTFAYRDAPSKTGSHGTGVRSVKGVADMWSAGGSL